MLSFPTPLRCAALISGGGRTVTNLVDRIKSGQLAAEIPIVIANRECAGVQRLTDMGLTVEVMKRAEFADDEAHNKAIFDRIRQARVDVVLLAGYLARLIIPHEFDRRVLNIHPALIPSFSGHGMYGDRVHAAVIERGCCVSGCTVHFCDDEYDHGPILVQKAVPVLADDTPDSLAARVFEAECEAYPEALELLMSGPVEIRGHRVCSSPRNAD
ncbi:MAG: phosphoribosylglycinamide formyltransferase [Planctomycetaceae bacterium]|nr:phosphoribosylglycinamide formyltransferase [Planctomycetaceae bacterium]MCB9953786.1 phosphoribosylglycinamide formyltransferase [Planctomycetaceae bacterium]